MIPDQSLCELVMVIVSCENYLGLESHSGMHFENCFSRVIARTVRRFQTRPGILPALLHVPGFACKNSSALRAICFSPVYCSALGPSSSGIHLARPTSTRISAVISSIVPAV